MGKTFSRKVYQRKVLPIESEKVDISKKPLSVLVDLLMSLSAQEDLTHNEISRNTFTRHLFIEYPDLSHRIFNFLANGDSVQSIKKHEFQDGVETILNNDTNEEIFNMYIKMYCGVKEYISAEEFHPITKITYNIFMDNHPKGPQICPDGISAVQNLVEGLFHKHTSLEIIQLQHQIQRYCPYLIHILHDYVTYKLCIAYKEVMELTMTETDLVVRRSKDTCPELPDTTITLSKVWSLATVLPRIYMHPFSPRSDPNILDSYSKLNIEYINIEYKNFYFPTHWCLLYNSMRDGNNPEAFLSSLLHYKGPTVTFIAGKRDKDFCVCINEEWHEAQTFWGDEDSYLIQFSPVFRTIHKGPKIIYMNFKSTGGRQGIQIGRDATNPTIVVNSSLDRITFNGKKSKLQKVEVWGCGTFQIKDLEFKKWNSNENVRKTANKSGRNMDKGLGKYLQNNNSNTDIL